MYELIQISEHDYYIDCPARIGLVRIDENNVVLIDSGSDKDAGKKVMKILDANNWHLKAIYNTHSHADHIGGNKLIQDRTDCRIFSKGLESVYTNFPQLEPAGLYGGLPFKELKHKFLMAQESVSLPLNEFFLLGNMEILELPGHSFDMIGFLTADGNAFIGDCVSSAQTLEKYGIGYLWDPESSLKTLEYIKTLNAVKYIPAHADVTDDITELADINIKAINSVKENLLSICSGHITFDDILKRVFDLYGLSMNAQQYVLIGSTIRSYLSSMYDSGTLTYEFIDNKMYWKDPAVPADRNKPPFLMTCPALLRPSEESEYLD